MIKQYFLIIGLVCCQVLAVQAQDFGLYFMDGIIQSTEVNPSFLPDRKVIYALPALSANFTNSISSYNGMLMENSEGTTVLNSNALLNKASAHNFVRGGFSLYTMNSFYGKENWRVSVSHALKGSNYFAYPKGLIELAAQGNAAFLGETMEIAPEFDITLYSETAFGYMMKLGKVNVGGRIKLLSGIANASSDRSSATLTTDPEYYQLNVATDYRINASGLFEMKGLNSEEDFNIDIRDNEFTFSSLFKRLNLGLDLGASMSLLDDNLMLSASIIDFGRINWKNNSTNFHSEGSFQYDGIDLNDAIEGDDISFDETLDSLTSVFDFQESNNSYATFLPTRFYLGAKFKANPFLSTGLLLFMEQYRGHSYPGMAIDVTTHLGKIFDFGLTGSQVYQSTNLGAHMALKLGPVQLILATDNILAVMDPYEYKNVNARFGLNLAFGKKHVGDSPDK